MWSHRPLQHHDYDKELLSKAAAGALHTQNLTWQHLASLVLQEQGLQAPW